MNGPRMGTWHTAQIGTRVPGVPGGLSWPRPLLGACFDPAIVDRPGAGTNGTEVEEEVGAEGKVVAGPVDDHGVGVELEVGFGKVGGATLPPVGKGVTWVTCRSISATALVTLLLRDLNSSGFIKGREGSVCGWGSVSEVTGIEGTWLWVGGGGWGAEAAAEDADAAAATATATEGKLGGNCGCGCGWLDTGLCNWEAATGMAWLRTSVATCSETICCSFCSLVVEEAAITVNGSGCEVKLAAKNRTSKVLVHNSHQKWQSEQSKQNLLTTSGRRILN